MSLVELNTALENKIITLNIYQKTIEENNIKIDALHNENDNIANEYYKIKDEVLIIQQKIKALETKPIVKTIKDLLPLINELNENQYHILTKIVTDVEYSKIYLSDYIANTDVKKKDIIGTVKVLGTYNEKKKIREEYEIKIYKKSDKGTFWCSCADHKFNSVKKGTCCKHICFLVCKVMKLLDVEFFKTKTLTQEQIDALIQKLTSDTIWKDSTITKEFDKITLELFKNFSKQIDDACPICFNDLEENEKPLLLACPTCHNYTHKECIEIWLEKQQRCVLCKSDVWKNYDKVKNGGSVMVI